MNRNRRQFLKRSSAIVAASLLPQSLLAASPARAALDKSNLIYLTPVLSNGKESRCHGEVWFVHHNNEVYVVTQAKAWRAEAIRQGLTQAKIWIGEFGVWTRSDDKFRSAPYLEISGALESDAAVHANLLTQFGTKYASEWSSWGPRFKKGLADGSRVMLRYQVSD